MAMGTHAKRQSPSRIPAQPAKDRRPDRGLTYPLNPSNSCRKPSKTHLLGSHKIGTKSSRTDGWKHFQTGGLEKRKRRKQDSSPRGGQLWLQTRCPNTPSKPLKAWRYRWWARMRNGRAPAGFQPNPPDRGLTYPLNPSNSCRKPSKTHLLGSHKIGTKSSFTDGWKHFQTVGLEKRKRRKQDSSPRGGQLWRQTGARCPNSAFETAKSMEIPVVSTHAKRPDRGLTYPLNPSNSCRKPSKTHLLGSHKIGTKSSRTDGWKHFQTGGLEKRKRRKQDSSPRGGQLWLQTRCPNTPSKPLKAWRYRWWARMRNGRAPAGF